MVNDFSGDSNCKGVWNFNTAGITIDSKGGNTLTDYNTCGVDTVDFKEGDQSIDKTASEALYIDDTDLDSGFPYKSGDTNKIISITDWFKFDAQSAFDGLVTKYDATGSNRSFILGCGGTATSLSWFHGRNGGASFTENVLFTSLVTGRWYHVGLVYNNSGGTVDGIPDRGYLAVLWDDTAGDYHAANATGTTSTDIYISSAALCLGGWMAAGVPNSTYGLDGHIDESVIFDDILTTDEIDEIRSGTYGAAPPTGRPLPQRVLSGPFAGPFKGVF